MIGAILRAYSYLYHLALSLFLLGISAIAMMSDTNLLLPMLPWTGETLVASVFWAGIFGIASVLLAVTGFFRYLFPLWCLVVLVMMVRGYLLQGYTFSGSDEFYRVLALIAGALLAFLFSLTLFRARKRRT